MHSFMSKKEIRDFNRCFEPNAFNTGPPVPSPATYAPARAPVELPDLTASPASTDSSSLSLSLEDEEIKKIFSDPRFDEPRYMQLDDSFAARRREEWNRYSSKEQLNPKAAPFVPSFVRPSILHNPLNMEQTSLFFPPERRHIIPPLELDGFPVLFGQEPPSTLAPLYPPGLPHPEIMNRRKLDSIQESESGGESDEEEPVPLPEAYKALLLGALRTTATHHERQVLIYAIVTSVDQWDMDSLLELSERISLAVFGSSADHEKLEEFSACDLIRLRDCGIDDPIGDPAPEGDRPEEVVAMVVEELYKQFYAIDEQTANAFLWDIRELVLREFIRSFDPTQPGSMNSHITVRTTPRRVRSALALCKSIASLYKRNLIMREHVSMCISILLNDLKSIEHLEALALIVIGCGIGFWDPPCPALPPLEQGSGESEAERMGLMAAMSEQVKQQLCIHVKEFLTGLEMNLISRGLNDYASLLGQGWGNGRFAERVRELVDAVKGWEAALLGMMTQTRVVPSAEVMMK